MNCKTCGQKILLEVGDRVEAIGEVDGLTLKGRQGTIIQIDCGSPPVLVEFDDAMDGHTGLGRCKDGHGWWGEHEDFKVIKTKGRGK